MLYVFSQFPPWNEKVITRFFVRSQNYDFISHNSMFVLQFLVTTLLIVSQMFFIFFSEMFTSI